jgi:basic membrane protein A
VLSGCAAAPEAEPTETAATATESAAPAVDYLACAVSDEGSWDDKSFNESVFDGLEKAKAQLGVPFNEAESETPQNFGPNLQAMVDANCDITFAVGFGLVPDVNITAAANPDMNFVTVDGFLEPEYSYLTNLKPVRYLMGQSSYLAGYLAASYSKTGIIGTYGGMNIPAVTVFMEGYYFGAMAYGVENGVEITVLGWDPMTKTGVFTDNFTPNSPESKAFAATQLNGGADVLFAVGGDQFGAQSEAIIENNGVGVIIGVDKNVALFSPEYAEYVLTSVEKRMTDAVYDIISELSSGAAFSGEDYVGTLANGGTALSPFYDFDSEISDAVKARLVEIEAGINSGEIDPLS